MNVSRESTFSISFFFFQGIGRNAELKVFLCLLAILGLVVRGEARSVTVAIPVQNMSVITFVVAKEKGFYQEEGLDVDLVLMTAATVATAALIGGNVDFSAVSGAGLPPMLRGAPLRFLFSTYYRPMFWLHAKPEIRDIKGLKGKRVGISNIGGGPDSVLRVVLKKHGLEGGRDVAIINLGSAPSRYAGLTSGVVDAAVISPPHSFMAEEAGFPELISFVKEDLVELQGSVLLREALLRSDPGLVEKFLRGTVKGFFYFRNNRSGTVPIIARYMKIKDDLAGKMYDSARPAATVDGTANEELQRKSIAHILERVDVKDPPPLERMFDFSMTKTIVDQLRAKGWKPE
jgi:ABC-type nitrate/sulfonate/bicarbonate transport system substrate-binding protein